MDPLNQVIYAFLAILGGTAVYFAILGVFELPIACGSLVLFIALVVTVWVLQPEDASP